MEKEKETIWLGLLHKGEEQAYKELFDKFYYPLSSFACKYLEEKEMAEDIVQDVLYNFWLNKLHFETFLELKSYLYKIVRNKCLDMLKHQRVKAKYLTEQTYKEQSEFFLNQILEEEVYTLLKQAVNVLPEQTRKVYELSLLGHDNQQISEILAITLDAVKAQKKRGKKILQEKLKNLLYLLMPFL